MTTEQELKALVSKLARLLRYEHEGHIGPLHRERGHCEACDAILEAEALDRRRKRQSAHGLEHLGSAHEVKL